MREPRLLIVEDNEEIAQMLALFLGSRGYKISLAPDGAAARQLVREFLPNLLLLDVGLPDTDGYELLKEFRLQVRTRYIPAIFLTQRSKKADKIAGLQLGADDFITKPFDLEELYLRVQNAVLRSDRENLSDPNSDLQRYTALLMNRVLNTIGTSDDFIGQTGEESFVVISAPDRAALIRKTVLDRFDNDAVQHYGMGERLGSQVKVKDPTGQERLLPLVKLEAVTLG